MKNQYKRPASFRAVTIIYFGLLIGQAILAMILFYMMQGQTQQLPEAPFNMIIPGAVFFGMAGAYLIGQQRASGIPINGTTQEKLEHFQTSKIIQLALAEGGNLISLVLTFTMANTQYMMWFGIGLAVFILLRPAKDRFMEDYQIGVGESFE